MATNLLREASELVDDLAEDRQTRWAPDVIADADLAEASRRPRVDSADVQLLSVPKPDGRQRSAPILSGSALAALRQAVEPLRALGDEALDPAVCGYRHGATGSSTYSEEYRRFREWAEALSDGSSVVVIADVSDFFASVTTLTLQRAIYDRYRGPWEPLEAFLGQMASLGVAGLPAGYGDARLVGNLVLAPVDRVIGAPFTRWVDDYRIFVANRVEADAAIDRMRDALRALGLELNDGKLQIVDVADYRSGRHGAPLDSVYHPQDESDAQVRANLRTVFADAVARGDRRLLRFALPRLAWEADSVAVPFALDALRDNSVDAPRLVDYLGSFVDDSRVQPAVEKMARDLETSDWILMRLFPLLCRLAIGRDTLGALQARFETSNSALVRGAILRVLSVHGKRDFVERALANADESQARALIAACFDLGLECPNWLAAAAPDTFAALTRLGSAPLPEVESIL
jgi:hypothetical protein